MTTIIDLETTSAHYNQRFKISSFLRRH